MDTGRDLQAVRTILVFFLPFFLLFFSFTVSWALGAKGYKIWFATWTFIKYGSAATKYPLIICGNDFDYIMSARQFICATVLSCRADYEKDIIYKIIYTNPPLSVLFLLSWHHEAQLLEINLGWKSAQNVSPLASSRESILPLCRFLNLSFHVCPVLSHVCLS